VRRRGAPFVLPNLVWLALFMIGPLVTLFVISFRGYVAGSSRTGRSTTTSPS
jgi:ABC-type sugar transport system permease subunit